jgi:alkylation response protein AidB-like acyl-CoA dehydrogenase
VALVSRAASLQAAVVGPAVCEAAIQVHGGIGFTWEYELHLYLRRARTIAALYSWEDSRVSDLLSRAVEYLVSFDGF